MDSMFSCYSLLNIKVIRLHYFVLINPYKFMISYLYFPNNLMKDIKYHIWTYMMICKIFFRLMVIVFKENLNL